MLGLNSEPNRAEYFLKLRQWNKFVTTCSSIGLGESSPHGKQAHYDAYKKMLQAKTQASVAQQGSGQADNGAYLDVETAGPYNNPAWQ